MDTQATYFRENFMWIERIYGNGLRISQRLFLVRHPTYSCATGKVWKEIASYFSKKDFDEETELSFWHQ